MYIFITHVFMYLRKYDVKTEICRIILFNITFFFFISMKCPYLILIFYTQSEFKLTIPLLKIIAQVTVFNIPPIRMTQNENFADIRSLSEK